MNKDDEKKIVSSVVSGTTGGAIGASVSLVGVATGFIASSSVPILGTLAFTAAGAIYAAMKKPKKEQEEFIDTGE